MTGFPDTFLWGAATAGHQVEGGNVNADMWPMEWAANSTFNEPSGDTCDHYHRYPEDIATLAGLGLNAYRFSVEWSRIEPEPGFYSPRCARPLQKDDRELPAARRHARGDVQPLHRPPLDGRSGRLERAGRAGALRRLRLPRHAAPRGPPVVGLHPERAEPHGHDAEHRRAGHGRGRSLALARPGRGRSRAASGASTRRATGWGSSPPMSSRWPPPIGWPFRPFGRPPPTSRRAGPWRSSTSNRPRTVRNGGARRGGWPRRTGSPSPPTTTSSGCRPTPAPASGRTASFPARRDGHHADRLGGLPRRARPHRPVGRRARRGARARHRERHGDRRRRGEDRLHPRRARGPGRMPGGRDRRPRLPPLDAARQLRMERRLLQDVRPHRRRPRDFARTVKPSARVAGPGGPAQRPRRESATVRPGRPVDLEADALHVGRQAAPGRSRRDRPRSRRGSCGPRPR